MGYKNKLLLFCLVTFCCLIFVSFNVANGDGIANGKIYTLELDRWKVSNKGNNALETTKGINQALQWAKEQGYTTFYVPAGIYLIDKESRINMVNDITFELDKEAILQKEANGKERYELLYIGPGTKNVTLKGGTYRGDKDVHDYFKKDSPYTSGTHEGGYGILANGAINLNIDDVKAENFTGDGLCIGASATMIDELYKGDFESGSIASNGALIPNNNKIRSKFSLEKMMTNEQSTFVIDHVQNLSSSEYDVFFYKKNGTFLSRLSAQKVTNSTITIPKEANYIYLVFDETTTDKLYIELWNKVITEKVTVKNSEFAFNRRQGITVGGAKDVLIINNIIHDTKGAAPQSGIDVEAGFFQNKDIVIKDNKFYNNAAYDVILFDGKDAIVEGNIMGSKGAIGLAISEPFTGALVKNNHFDRTRIMAYHDATFIGNKINDSLTYFTGPNIKIEDMVFTDALFSISSKDPFGVTASNITIQNNNKKKDSGLSIWGKPVHLKNITIIGQPAFRAISGGVEGGSIFENLKITGYNPETGLDLPRGTYNNCEFVAAKGGKDGPKINLAGKYEFNNCSFKNYAIGLHIGHKDAIVTIENSDFQVMGDAVGISAQAANKVEIVNNFITANGLTRKDIPLIKVNNYWQKERNYDVAEVLIKENTIISNLDEAIGISTIYSGINAPVSNGAKIPNNNGFKFPNNNG
ncbi:right-handed parallel beta-helix repeat-containing protein [Pseudalkalibacillus caeni]|uniref:Right-handed parallel beta-helix repeat-containing protein n=1 Tax=Exobacillus caeni TaxID=2574798 RepID=A0A5R9F5L0_9BACL|nr:right-handed parallel beta-helix repeat-containing protein [Pseudalkalibacillus caeni]TLS35764.1 right-handed parallel beta-helix repeat-containing protein [Pseudalkalibacillus caeni]